jgi:hypothetical protein
MTFRLVNSASTNCCTACPQDIQSEKEKGKFDNKTRKETPEVTESVMSNWKGHSDENICNTRALWGTKTDHRYKQNSVAISPQANYTD